MTLTNLGLVCITYSDQVRYRTITRKRLFTFAEAEQAQVLQSLYADNLQRLKHAIAFCATEQIKLYRIPSNLFPFADSPVGEAILNNFAPELAEVGERAIKMGLRLVIHPDQYVVLSSDRPEVIQNSLQILQTQARILDLLRQPQSPWAILEIHGGKANRAEQLLKVIQSLPIAIRSRLALENDEYAYSASEILTICRAANIPMVFDAHHHIIHEALDDYDDKSVGEILAAAQTTWPITDWQLVHISNGSEFLRDRRHSDLIEKMPLSYRNAPWIEVEAKQKERAIEKLRAEWLLCPENH